MRPMTARSRTLGLDGKMGSIARIGKAAVRMLKGTDAALQGVELSAVALATAGAAVAAVVGLPAYLIWRLVQSGHLVAGAVLLGTVCLLAANLARDLKRREVGWVSATLATAVTVWCVYVALMVIG
jgi:hypothetical protein